MNPKPVDKMPDKTLPDPLASEMPTIELRGHTYEDHREMVPTLLDTMAACGCWLLEQRALSPTATELSFEILLRSVFELYSGLLSSGVDLSRDSHTCMKSLCMVRDHNPHNAKRRRVITIRLELMFLEETDSVPDLAKTAMGIA
jgi:hypothetical protein